MNIGQLIKGVAFLIVVSLIIGCGGGGDDGDSNGGGGGDGGNLDTNACSTLNLSTRIIDGTECDTSNSPVLRLDLTGVDGRVYTCSATLITPTQLLTAGHCYKVTDIVQTNVVVGTKKLQASKVTIDPGYDDRTGSEGVIYNDAAIVEVSSAIDRPTVPVLTGGGVNEGDIISIFGFGVDENGRLGTLRSGTMEVTDVTGAHISALFTGDGSNTCSGDSGGPAIFSRDGTAMVAGVTSTGTVVNCTVGDISRFTNTSDSDVASFIASAAPGADLR